MITKTENKTKSILGYRRVSKISQVMEGCSLENQSDSIKRYCELHKHNLTEIISDEGISGKDTKHREGFLYIMDMVKSKSIDGVVCYSLSRWTRNVRDLYESLEVFKKVDVDFISIKENIDTSTSIGRFSLQLIGSIYELEREQISERVSDILQYKKRLGEVYGVIPFGYKREGNKLVYHESEQKTLRLIHHLRKQGNSLTKICDVLNTNNHKTKQGKQFNKQILHSLIKTKRPCLQTN